VLKKFVETVKSRRKKSSKLSKVGEKNRQNRLKSVKKSPELSKVDEIIASTVKSRRQKIGNKISSFGHIIAGVTITVCM
jgi:hypothetical protein